MILDIYHIKDNKKSLIKINPWSSTVPSTQKTIPDPIVPRKGEVIKIEVEPNKVEHYIVNNVEYCYAQGELFNIRVIVVDTVHNR